MWRPGITRYWGRKDSGTVRTKRGEEARYLSPYPLIFLYQTVGRLQSGKTCIPERK